MAFARPDFYVGVRDLRKGSGLAVEANTSKIIRIHRLGHFSTIVENETQRSLFVMAFHQ